MSEKFSDDLLQEIIPMSVFEPDPLGEAKGFNSLSNKPGKSVSFEGLSYYFRTISSPVRCDNYSEELNQSKKKNHDSDLELESFSSAVKKCCGCFSSKQVNDLPYTDLTDEEVRSIRIYEKMKGTVVCVKCILSNGEEENTITGSGVVISEDGLIVTCAHLLHDYENPEYSLKTAKVVFFNKETYKVKLIDEDEGKDLALLKIIAGKRKFSSYAKFAKSEEIKTGRSAYLISNPHGYNFSLIKGTVSYEKRLYSDMHLNGPMQLDADTAIIQTNLASDKGSSGGPILNSNEEIMGLQSRGKGSVKFGIHTDSILKFTEKNNIFQKKK